MCDVVLFDIEVSGRGRLETECDFLAVINLHISYNAERAQQGLYGAVANAFPL